MTVQFKDYLDTDIDSYLTQMFKRTWLFQTKEEQLKKMNTKILCGGVGIGSQISECLVRDSFMNIILADGDHFEAQNKSRQNCSDSDLGLKKVSRLASHLKDINSRGNYLEFADYLDKKNLKNLLPQVDYFINCIDFDSEVFLEAHRLAKKHGVIEIFPFVIGQYACVIVIDKNSKIFEEYFETKKTDVIKQKIIKMCIDSMRKRSSKEVGSYLTKIYEQYQINGSHFESDPQSCIGVFKAAALVTQVIENLVQGRERSVLKFPLINFS